MAKSTDMRHGGCGGSLSLLHGECARAQSADNTEDGRFLRKVKKRDG